MARRKKVQPATIPDPNYRFRYPPQVENPDSNTTEYDLRSNIGQQFGSQGTLFQISKRPRNVAGPKGFSPERQDEVRAKTSLYTSRVGREIFGPVTESETEDGHPTREASGKKAHANRLVQDLIARSTAPLPDRKVGIFAWRGEDEVKRQLSHRYSEMPAAGMFRRESASSHMSQIDINASQFYTDPDKPTRLRSEVLLHELGHHHSQETNPDKDYSTPEGQGREEAYADDFSVRHSPQGRLLNYQSPYPDTGRGPGFREAYDTARTAPTTWHEAWSEKMTNPNVPGSGRDALADPPDHPYWEKTKEETSVPPLPGMENAQDFTAKNHFIGRGYRRPDSFEFETAHASRVINRQTQSISDQLAGR